MRIEGGGGFSLRSFVSGSSGNAYLAQAGASALLIDAGLSLKAFRAQLEALGLEDLSLDGILLTHEHQDHCKGVEAIARAYSCPILATPGTLGRSWRKREALSLEPLKLGEERLWKGWRFLGLSTSHDAREPAFFRLSREEGGPAAAILTDTGLWREAWLEVLRPCSLLFLESNYEPELLWMGPYPEPLKQRIDSPLGHLSNYQALELVEALEALEGPRRTYVLSHLSETNNSPDQALLRLGRYLRRLGRERDLFVAPAAEPSPLFWVGREVALVESQEEVGASEQGPVGAAPSDWEGGLPANGAAFKKSLATGLSSPGAASLAGAAPKASPPLSKSRPRPALRGPESSDPSPASLEALDELLAGLQALRGRGRKGRAEG